MHGRGRILLLGGSGHLGTALAREMESRGLTVDAPPRAEVDLRDADLATEVARRAPAAVVNAAAYNDVDGAESEANRAEVLRLNRDVPAALARTCREREVPLVHVSTDYVFDGRKGEPYVEDDAVGPLQAYGRSKREGERAVLAACPGALVVRTSTLFGADGRCGSSFVDAVLARARAAGRVDVVRLPVSSPTYAPDLARALLALLDAGAAGIVHVANAGGCSRLELAREALRQAGLEREVVLRERTDVPPGAPRPAYSVLDTARYRRITGRSMRPWQEAVREHVGRR
jgi:dTDP-4-dehydrorhamnose reductase